MITDTGTRSNFPPQTPLPKGGAGICCVCLYLRNEKAFLVYNAFKTKS